MNFSAPVPLHVFETIKSRQRATWASGDFGRIGIQFQIVGERLCEAVDLRSADYVLDVAAGNGNASLAAARRFADVTAIDDVPELLDQIERRAEAEGLLIVTRAADAERLPFDDGEFDVALSTFGVMFTPDQERAAGEMRRVVRRGGRIGLASWTPDGFYGELHRLLAGFVPLPEGLPSPTTWGSETRMVELFGPYAADIRTRRRTFVFRNLSAGHWIDVFRRHDGPVATAFEALDPAGQARLHTALVDLLCRYNRAGDDALVLPGSYLEAVIHLA